ncbi:hypothetical protein COO60DRAFT_1479385 [Scenedesmus sp. NREL 46B-D3]|nr:hypothetical protein COO60DRAFT_1479385 [Scenedesmus sp. NREL 46B-D3]
MASWRAAAAAAASARAAAAACAYTALPPGPSMCSGGRLLHSSAWLLLSSVSCASVSGPSCCRVLLMRSMLSGMATRLKLTTLVGIQPFGSTCSVMFRQQPWALGTTT